VAWAGTRRRMKSREATTTWPGRWGRWLIDRTRKRRPSGGWVGSVQRPPRRSDRGPAPEDRPGTFDSLGFTHFWGKSRKGANVVKQRAAASRLRRAIGTVAAWCRRVSHRSVAEQQRGRSRKLVGHYGYYGITGNADALVESYNRVTELWRRWLSRRSWAGRLSWDGFKRLLGRLALPGPRVVHSVLLT
jgi:RNA-directed DNA polymerase